MLDEEGCCYTGGGELYAAVQVVKFCFWVAVGGGLAVGGWWLVKTIGRLTVQQYRGGGEWGLGIVVHPGDGWCRRTRRGWGYVPVTIRVGFGPWVWRVTL